MATDIDLVLVNPGGRARIYQSLATEVTAVEPPVWAGLMASFVRGRGHSVAIIDSNAEELGPEEAAARAIEMRPRMVAVPVYGHQPSASTQVMPGASAVVTALKDLAPELPVLMVGGHVASLPQRTLAEERCDFVADGEGLHTMVELLEALAASSTPDLSRVRGLWTRDGDGAKCTATASPTSRSTPHSAVRTTARSVASRRRSRAASRWPATRTASTRTASGVPLACSRI
ncbi:MAG: cobalamin B12-binding domain-containing protein [Proteobacteria bacterium]|nr:cobalamin B12-binding domain-containing protein [Pseudomonadota bacterium]